MPRVRADHDRWENASVFGKVLPTKQQNERKQHAERKPMEDDILYSRMPEKKRIIESEAQ